MIGLAVCTIIGVLTIVLLIGLLGIELYLKTKDLQTKFYVSLSLGAITFLGGLLIYESVRFLG